MRWHCSRPLCESRTTTSAAPVAQVERLASDIGQIDGFRADVADSPLDTSPTLALSGHMADKDAKTMESRFVLRVVRDHGAT